MYFACGRHTKLWRFLERILDKFAKRLSGRVRSKLCWSAAFRSFIVRLKTNMGVGDTANLLIVTEWLHYRSHLKRKQEAKSPHLTALTPHHPLTRSGRIESCTDFKQKVKPALPSFREFYRIGESAEHPEWNEHWSKASSFPTDIFPEHEQQSSVLTGEPQDAMPHTTPLG